jgi:hypothetical protein
VIQIAVFDLSGSTHFDTGLYRFRFSSQSIRTASQPFTVRSLCPRPVRFAAKCPHFPSEAGADDEQAHNVARRSFSGKMFAYMYFFMFWGQSMRNTVENAIELMEHTQDPHRRKNVNQPKIGY